MIKIAEISSKFKFPNQDFQDYVNYHFNEYVSFECGELVLKDESHLDEILRKYTNNKVYDDSELKKIIEANNEKKKKLSSILITSGFSFAGYKIVKYGGFISGDDSAVVCSNEGGFGILSDMKKVQDNFMKSLQIIRRNALIELKEAAYDMGCNAVIGVDFDYNNLELSFGNGFSQYLFSVTANGNAAIIEKE